MTLAVSSHNVYAVNSIDWTYDGDPFSSSDPPFPVGLTVLAGELPWAIPLSVRVDATDEGDFTSNDKLDTIDVVVSTLDENVTYTLTETGPNDGIFTGINFVLLTKDYRYHTTDIVNLIYTIPDSLSNCDTDDTITYLDATGGYGNGIRVYSDSDLAGVGLVLTETGENTCTFEGQLKFTTTGSTDDTTGTLQVSQGDILTFYDELDGQLHNGQIIPTIPGKGSIIASFDEPNDDNTAEIFVTYNGLSSGFDLNSDERSPGTGTGGPITRPGLVLNFIAALLGGGGTKSAPPTLGLDKNLNRIVDEGFSFNGNPVDVQQFYTPYPLITTEVGNLNTIRLKIYENNGPDNIAHVGLSYGLGKGETFNEGRATIEYDKTFDGIESVTLFDPNNVLGSVNVTTAEISCSVHNNAKCLEVTFDHIFRESLEYNMVATNIWDFQRNGWQNYFNHGIQIEGESMNPPEQYSGIYKGHIHSLTETGKNTAIDDDRNSWTFDKTWNRDYIKPVIADSDILNSDKMWAIEHLGYKYSDGKMIFGFDRMDHRFADTKNQQQIEAQTIMANLCLGCKKEPFEKINDIFSYDMPPRYSKLTDPETVNQMNLENQKAQEFLKQYFEKIYPGRIND